MCMKTPPDLMKGQELNHQSKTHDIPYNRKYGVLFQQDIVAVNKKDMLAILRIQFLNRKIKAGLRVR